MSRPDHHPGAPRRALFLLLTVGLVASLSGAGSAAAADPGPPVRLGGHVLSRLARLKRTGPLPADRTLRLTVALRPPAPDALRNAVAARGHADGARLTAAEIGRAFGRPDSDLAALAAYFDSFGLTVGSPAPDRLSFPVRGTAAQVERALAVSLDTYTDASGARFFAPSVDPRLPARLAPMVQAVLGLDDYPALRPMHPPFPTKGSRAAGAPTRAVAVAPIPGEYTPANLAAAYDLPPLYAAGRNGAGETIGVIGCDAYSPSDVQQFDAAFGLPQRSIGDVPVDGGADGSDPETTLDLEWSGAIAPAAALAFYGFPSSNGGCPFSGFFDAVSRAVGDGAAGVLSVSLGACEDDYAADGILQGLENELAAATLAGQSVLAASGDSGAYCDTFGGALEPMYPASSAFATAVGGTALSLNADGSYASESAWGSLTECMTPCGSGGGISNDIAEPSWQDGDGVNSGGMRGVPDVALDADPSTGYLIYFGALGGWVGGVGGTSVATPEWAGIVALADQGAGRRLGLLGPLLYGPTVLRARSSANPPYHDVTTGNNLYYSAGPGWDFATGWGSPDAARLVNLLIAPCGAGTAATAASSAPSRAAAAYRIFLPLVLSATCTSG